jgi:hypothetical protein
MYCIGIDVVSKESALCILHRQRQDRARGEVSTNPDVIARFVADTALPMVLTGLEFAVAAVLFARLEQDG